MKRKVFVLGEKRYNYKEPYISHVQISAEVETPIAVDSNCDVIVYAVAKCDGESNNHIRCSYEVFFDIIDKYNNSDVVREFIDEHAKKFVNDLMDGKLI